MIKVGNREVVLNVTTFIPESEEAEIEINLGVDDILTLILAFDEDQKNTSDEKLNATYEISGQGDKGKITFKNWTSTFGSSITKPIHFASDNYGNRITLLANVIKLGSMYKVECQFMRGGDE